VDGSIRLDLGCGDKKQEGWTSVDFGEFERTAVHTAKKYRVVAIKPDVSADLRALPFPDNYADEARAIHVIEHFYPWEAEDLVREWVRVLKPGAPLALECPCLDKVMKLWDVPQVPPAMTYWALYGDPRYKEPLMAHHWCYSQMQLIKLMANAGLEDIRPEPVQFHHPIRDMRIVGNKPEAGQRVVLPGHD
jgi:SAM-dependent methyltransferase